MMSKDDTMGQIVFLSNHHTNNGSFFAYHCIPHFCFKIDFQEFLITLKCNNTWASSRENLSLGFPTKRDSNQSPQLQRLARK